MAEESWQVPPLDVLVVTGLSGAGKSTTVAALEDLGYFCVDNLPIPLVLSTLQILREAGVGRVALGMDVRVGTFFERASEVLDALSHSVDYHLAVVFLDASDPALLRRFGSTRRPHPLSTVSTPGVEREALAVLDGVLIERERLADLKGRASIVIDTTDLTVHDLRRQIVATFGRERAGQLGLHLRFVSFGFKYGLPVDADLVLDVRFLQNPYFVDALRDLTGRDPAVRAYVMDSEEGKEFFERAVQLLEYCLPRFEREGKSYLTVAIGCTGGRHRSVALVEAMAARLRHQAGIRIEAVHRDIGRDAGVDSVRESVPWERSLGRGGAR